MASISRALLFSIDTEPDHLWMRTRKTGYNFTHENIDGIAKALPLFERYALKPTLFVSFSVASSEACSRVLLQAKQKISCEIGSHFHPCDTPPFCQGREKETDNILRVPDNLLAKKFERLHSVIVTRFGRPASYRSGAWTIDSRIVRLLMTHGYRVDSSVTPGISWSLIGRPSYQHAPRTHYVLDLHNVSMGGSSGILEIPVSIWTPRPLLSKLPSPVSSFFTMPMASRRNMPLLQTQSLRSLRPQWLRPAFQSLDEMEAIAKPILEEAGFLHIMCHSAELTLGTSPYVQTDAEQKEFFHRLEGIFRCAVDAGCVPETLSGFAERANPSLEKDSSNSG